MMAPKDQQIEALLDEKDPFKSPTLMCSSGHQIRRVCSNDQCTRDALICDKDEDECKICGVMHEHCTSITIKSLNKKVQQRLCAFKKIFRSIFAIQSELMNQLSESRREAIDKIKFREEKQKTIDSIYFKHNINGIKGKQIKELLTQLLQKEKENNAQEYIQQYKNKGKDFVDSLKKIRSNILSYLNNPIPSKILSKDQQGLEKYNFLLKQLNEPTQLKLIYRASQHNFSATKFHKFCDGIGDTLTIVRTEFGKTIAAFTPVSWNIGSGNYIADNSLRSFLLQLQLKEKMTLTKPQDAVCHGLDYGPIFGAGHDLYISDQCNINKDSYSNFPFTYNYKGKYQNNQKSYNAFCGSSNGKNFRVVEYEVFAVLK